MPPRRRTAAPIPVDVDELRRKLADGKIVRVGLSRSAQFPDGGTGRVRHIGDPSVDGEEFIQVEVSLNGTRDVLPFTPGDLTPATRTAPAAAPSPTRASSGKAPAPRAREPQPRRSASGVAVQETNSLFGDAGPTSLPTGPSEIVVTASNPPPAAPLPAAPRRCRQHRRRDRRPSRRAVAERSGRWRWPSRSPPPTPIHLNGASRPGSGFGSCSAPGRSHRPGSGTWSACWTTRR